jgi:hypothetical protein
MGVKILERFLIHNVFNHKAAFLTDRVDIPMEK